MIVAFLSIPDPRERPDRQGRGGRREARAVCGRALRLRHGAEPVAGLARAGRRRQPPLRHWCREHFLSFLRLREWADLREQLAGMMPQTWWKARSRAAAQANTVLHQALLTGLPRRHRRAGRGAHLPRRPRRALRDRARHAAADAVAALDRGGEPGRDAPAVRAHGGAGAAVVDRVGRRAPGQAHLRRRASGTPARGMAFARETVSLYGRVLSSGRRVELRDGRSRRGATHVRRGGAGARPVARCRSAFLERNAATARAPGAGRELPAPARPAGGRGRAGAVLPRAGAARHVASTRAFDKWWRARGAPCARIALDAAEDVFLARPLPRCGRRTTRNSSMCRATRCRCLTTSIPTSRDDGATLEVPLPLLRVLDAQRLEWLVPGWLRKSWSRCCAACRRKCAARSCRFRPPRSACCATCPAVRRGLAVRARCRVRDAGGRHARIDVADAGRGAAAALAQVQPARGSTRAGHVRCAKGATWHCAARRHCAELAARGACGRSGTALGARRRARTGTSTSWPAETTSSAAGGCGCAPIRAMQDEGASVRLHLFTTAAAHSGPRAPASCDWPRWRCRSSTNWRGASGRATASSRCCWPRPASARTCSARSRTAPWPTRCSAPGASCRAPARRSRSWWIAAVPTCWSVPATSPAW